MPFQRQSHSYESLDLIARALEKIYADAKVRIQPGSELRETIDRAKELAAWWKAGHSTPLATEVLPRALCCLRIASCALFLDPRRQKSLLRDLTKGALMFWDNEQSKAKDTEWEINVWAHLRQAKLLPFFAEPDLQITIDGLPLGLACKKLYSLENADKQISKGIKQITGVSLPGILCLSLDSLIQPDLDIAILKVKTQEEARSLLQEKLQTFAEMKKKRVQDRYFSQGRLAGIILSVQAFADIEETKERAIHCQETLVWTDVTVNEERKDRVKSLHEKLKGAIIPREEVLSQARTILGEPT